MIIATYLHIMLTGYISIDINADKCPGWKEFVLFINHIIIINHGNASTGIGLSVNVKVKIYGVFQLMTWLYTWVMI